MKIPFVDLKAQYLSIKNDIDQAVKQVIEETSFIGGPVVSKFEDEFSKLYGVKNVISCANGTDSLYILMKMLGIGRDDEVITAANSWISSSETITQTGARPVFIDADPRYFSLDETRLESLITPRTRALIAVHLQGQMCAMDELKAICDKHAIHLIEDCAQSHFSAYKDKRAGLFGVAGSFSFYPGKNLGAYGDAGCIITNDDALAEKCRMYARHGALVKHQHQMEGINSRMDGMQAAILTAKLQHILEWTGKRIAKAALYDKALSGIGQIKLPAVRPDTKHTYHLYMIRCERRDQLAAWLKEKGIETAIHYPAALPNLPAYTYLGYQPGDFPVATALQNDALSLPIYPELTEEMIGYVAGSIGEFYSNQ
ncbi:MAG TPA: DegT/DnrJ/EryC1/StrS family aminotransferase [Puia sp.]|jgi:dTDP-4-amino-4,6-dideoxygalactose transaminase|nr:DegT/DnrJ/EryC1/StrS family aminotransferase [Puia sp.]